MSVSINFFCHWSAEFEVEYVPSPDGTSVGFLRFKVAWREGVAVLREFFDKWHQRSLGGKASPDLLNALLSLADTPIHTRPSEEWAESLLATARELGPLFIIFPWHGLSQNPEGYMEPVEKWHQAAVHLKRLAILLEQVPTVSRDSSPTARQRRAVASAQWAYGEATLAQMTAAQRSLIIASHKPSPGMAPIHDLESQIADGIGDIWLLHLTNPKGSFSGVPRLIFSAEKNSIQLNLPTGIQALLVMLLHDQRLGRTLLLRNCARQDCRRLMFMRPRQKYCSDRCQTAEAVRRHRAKVRPKKKPTSRKRGANQIA